MALQPFTGELDPVESNQPSAGLVPFSGKLDESSAPEQGFFPSVFDLAKSGAKSTMSAARIAPGVISGNVEDQAATIANELATERKDPKELKELKTAFADVTKKGEAADDFASKARALGGMLYTVGEQAITNPKGLVYMTAEQLANMAPAILGMLGGAKAGATVGALGGPAGAITGSVVGGVAGGFAGSAPIEIGSEFVSIIGKELGNRKLAPTEANIKSLLSDQNFLEGALSDARTKGATTAAIDSAFTVGAGRIATGANRAALAAAQKELGATADAAKIAARAQEIMAARTLGQKAITGGKAVGLETVGGGVSEAGGQLAAYGEADLGEVGMEMLGSLSGAAASVPAAARSVRESLVPLPKDAEITPVSEAPDTVGPPERQFPEQPQPQDTSQFLSAEEARIQKQRQAQEEIDKGTYFAPEGRAPVTEEDRVARQEEIQRQLDQEAGFPTEPRPIRSAEYLATERELRQEEVRRQLDERAGIPTEPRQPKPITPEEDAAAQRAAAQVPETDRGYADLFPMDGLQAKQRLAVLRFEAEDQGLDPLNLVVVPHPRQDGKFAIQALQKYEYTPEMQGNKIVTPTYNAIENYLDTLRNTNTEAAIKFVRDYDEGRLTDEDVRAALEAELRRDVERTRREVATPVDVATERLQAIREGRVPTEKLPPPREKRRFDFVSPEAVEPVAPPTPPVDTAPITPEKLRENIARVFDATQGTESYTGRPGLVANRNDALIPAVKSANMESVLDVLENSPSPMYRRIGELSRKLKTTIDLGTKSKMKNAAGQYFYMLDKILIRPDHANSQHTIAHELVHAQVYHAVENPNIRQRPVVKKLNDLYTFVKDKAKKENWNFYGITDIHEFNAEAFTNPEFQFFLANTKYKNTTAWGKFTQYIANLIGIKNDNAFSEFLSLTENLGAPGIGKGKVKRSGSGVISQQEAAEQAISPVQTQPVQPDQAAPNPKIRTVFQQPAPAATFTAPTESKFDSLIYALQDKNVDLLRIQQILNKQGKDINDEINAYQKEMLSHGAIAEQEKQFIEKELRPILMAMKQSKITMDELNTYLHNRHAEERNIQMNKVNQIPVFDANNKPVLDADGNPVMQTNPALVDRGSGISTENARKYLAGLDPKRKAELDKVAADVDKIIKKTQQVLVDSGIETQETVDKWNSTYGSYVPLFREDQDFVSSNSGMPTGISAGGGASKRATGSTLDVKDIFESLVLQREKAIVRAENNKIGNALFGLAVENPNPKFWLPIDPNAVDNPEQTMTNLADLGVDPADIQNIMSLIKRPTINPRTGLVEVRANPADLRSKNVITTRMNGKDMYIILNENDPRAKRMVESLRNADLDQMNMVMSAVSKITRFIASINTQYNPVFGIKNFIRDGLGVGVNLSSTPLRGKQAQVYRDAWASLPGIWEYIRADGKDLTSDTAKLMQQMKEDGGGIGFRQMYARAEKDAGVLNKEMEKLNRGNVSKAAYGFVNLLGDFNEVLENSFRLSTYKNALDMGLSREQAANLSKNISVNFNKTGASTRMLGGLFAFLNASIQGSARLAQTLASPAGKKIMLGGVGIGLVQSLMLGMAGFGDDDPPEFVKEKNFVVPLPDGTYIAIPMPPGLLVLPNAGRLFGEAIFGEKDPYQAVAKMTGIFLDAFNPVGGSDNPLMMLAPTALDPIVAVAANKDAFGRPISKEDTAMRPTPGYLRSRESSFEVTRSLAEFINYISGGSDYKKGVFSPTADDIEFLIGQATGGIGRAGMQTAQMAANAAVGEETAPHKVPLLGAFYGDTQSDANVRSKFFNTMKEINAADSGVKKRQDAGQPSYDIISESPVYRFSEAAKSVNKQIAELNKQKTALINRDAPKADIRRIEDTKLRIMQQFNQMTGR